MRRRTAAGDEDVPVIELLGNTLHLTGPTSDAVAVKQRLARREEADRGAAK